MRFAPVQEKVPRGTGTKSFKIVGFVKLDPTNENNLVSWDTGTSKYFLLNQSKSLYFNHLHLIHTTLSSLSFYFSPLPYHLNLCGIYAYNTCSRSPTRFWSVHGSICYLVKFVIRHLKFMVFASSWAPKTRGIIVEQPKTDNLLRDTVAIVYHFWAKCFVPRANKL